MSRSVVVEAVGEEGSDIKEVRRYRDCGNDEAGGQSITFFFGSSEARGYLP